MKVACIAQLVNVIAPIMTENGGPAWKQTIYYPLYFASLYGRGDALAVAVDVPTYDAAVADDVPYLDVAAVRNSDGKTLTFFVVNRHPDEAMTIDMSLAGFKPKAIVEHMTIAHPDLQATNTAQGAEQGRAARRARAIGLRDGAVRGKLPPRSYHVIRVAHLSTAGPGRSGGRSSGLL